MPYELMLEMWLRAGHLESDFWQLTYRQFDRWMRANFEEGTRFGRGNLHRLMEMFPDVV